MDLVKIDSCESADGHVQRVEERILLFQHRVADGTEGDQPRRE
jgi:hypothetical protein